ncbi:TonB-dependent receptor plug domain-containing protein [Rudanella paleaurantiibacter]|uniref:TonB-dependent receptor plug domain-containing protein n=1 Tax=Rudanella paleaurantiibacter TaxID=2614655 RepID=A0A7J5TWR6_9BACT|nr:TonB-dependent receptor [Rudanella paleaurantiibacter]KAB7729027.1 TonB-dependent receptor plug domain-containing protein [Rudanella paleaurantiibacter]
MTFRYLFLWALVLPVSAAFAQSVRPRTNAPVATVSGYVREAGSQEALIGVNVYLPGTSTGTTTNTYGFYSLTLPAQDSVRLAYSFVGYEAVEYTLPLRRDIQRNVILDPGKTLSEVTVTSSRTQEKVSDTPQMSQIDIPVQQIKKIPAFLGEKDVLKVLQLMPGVQKGSEGSTGIYVRGGGPDQNLIILDDAVVYNANHLFGFFSVFNGDALKSVELTKGGFPARFGGRLSSVIDLNMKDGNREKLHGEGGIGLISSRLTLEGPLAKNKKPGERSGSFLVSGRRTYLDVVAAPLIRAQTDGQTQAGYYFYDLNAKVNYDLTDKDKVYLSGYFGRDRFYAKDNDSGTDVGLGWGNATGTLRWNHLFSQRLFSNLSLIYSDYKFQIASDERGRNNNATDLFSLRYNSGIRDFSLKYDLDFYPNPQHSLRFGVQTIQHRFTPSAIVLKNAGSVGFDRRINNIDVLESGIYAEDTWRPNERWRLNGGLRLSHFIQKEVNYIRPEPRLSAAYMLKPDLSLKGSYALMNQYIHLLSNTGIGLPTDLWVPTTDRVAPQQSEQVAAGLAKDFNQSGLSLTVEGYYKTMKNIINYREGASFLLLGDPTSAQQVRWEDNVTSGRGWSYGAEFLLQKKTGRFSGWAGYTLSWTQWQFPLLNGGQKFYPRYDRRHDISLVGIYELSKRITLSAAWVYGTGNALTVPQAEYRAYRHEPGIRGSSTTGAAAIVSGLFDYGARVSDYGTQKNTFRAEAYHRMDFGIQFHKKKRHHERTWEFSFYNLYNRRNPFFYQIESVTEGQAPNQTTRTGLFRYSVFPIVPAFSYNFKF